MPRKSPPHQLRIERGEHSLPDTCFGMYADGREFAEFHVESGDNILHEVVRRWNNHTMTTNQLKAIWAMLDAGRDPLNKEAMTWAEVMERPGTKDDGLDTGVTGGRVKVARVLRKLADRDVFMRQKIKELTD